MCGIAGYVGAEAAVENVFSMLKRLEYRGYDSAGIAYLLNGSLTLVKDRGKVDEVREKAKTISGPKIALGHSRWATHGPPSQNNAHPHSDCSSEIALVHNGIIENHEELKERLKGDHKFCSETDSEVIAHLIEDNLQHTKSFEEAFISTLRSLEGSYAILAIYSKEPDRIYFARNESPLLIGVGAGENFLASDMPAILPATKKAVFLDDMEYGYITAKDYCIRDVQTSKNITKDIHTSKLSVELAEKGGHEHFMLKEILEESAAVKNALRSKDDARDVAESVGGKGNIFFVACGTAWHAGVVARYMLQEHGLCSSAEVASEFRYSTVKTITDRDTVILISQSGETADTIAAAKAAKDKGAKVIAVVNVLGSSLTRIADASIYTHSGPEIAVASTKVYLGQITALTLFSLAILLKQKKISKDQYTSLLIELENLPEKIDQILDNRERIAELAQVLSNTNDYFYIARRLNYPTAMEGALKLKEISYLHAESYPGGELKHGPLALMEEKVCVIAINPDDDLRKKMASNIQEVRARNAKVIELGESDIFMMESEPGTKIMVPKTSYMLTPLTMAVPLHLLSYYVARSKGLPIDKPRNLAKSVTVE